MKNGSKILSKLEVIILASLMAFPFVSAQSFSNNIAGFMDTGFRGIFNVLSRESIRAGITLVLFFILLYSIMLVATKRIKIFQDGDKVNKQGKVFAFAFTALSVIGLFFLSNRFGGFYETAEAILTGIGQFGMIIFGIVIFLLVYYGFSQKEGKKKPCVALVATGLAFMLPSSIMGWWQYYSFGLLLLIIGAIWCFIDLVKGTGGSSSSSRNGTNTSSENPSGDETNNVNDPNSDKDSKNKNGNVTVKVTEMNRDTPVDGARVYVMHPGNVFNPKSWAFWNTERKNNRFVGSRWSLVGETGADGITEFETKSGRRRIKVVGPRRYPYKEHRSRPFWKRASMKNRFYQFDDVFKIWPDQDNELLIELKRIGPDNSDDDPNIHINLRALPPRTAPADDTTPVILEAFITYNPDSASNEVPAGTPVTFTARSAHARFVDRDGNPIGTDGSNIATVNTVNNSGRVHIRLVSSEPGDVVVIANVDNVNSATVTVNFRDRDAELIIRNPNNGDIITLDMGAPGHFGNKNVPVQVELHGVPPGVHGEFQLEVGGALYAAPTPRAGDVYATNLIVGDADVGIVSIRAVFRPAGAGADVWSDPVVIDVRRGYRIEWRFVPSAAGPGHWDMIWVPI